MSCHGRNHKDQKFAEDQNQTKLDEKGFEIFAGAFNKQAARQFF